MSDARSTVTGGPGVGDLFQIFRDGQARTRSEIATETGLSRNTVTAKVDALLAEGLLAPDGSASSSGGRPPARLVLNAGAWRILAIDLGATHASVAVTDLRASVLSSVRKQIDIGEGPEAILGDVLDVGARMLDELDHRSSRDDDAERPLIGIGIGLPGGVEHSTGRPIQPPIMPGWDGFDVTGFVRSRFDVTVLVDNDVNILALGEHELSWPDIDDLVFVKVATGLGAGIIAGRQLQRGAQGIAGDIGYVQVPYGRDSNRAPDDDETLANLASATAIADQLRKRGTEIRSNAELITLLRSGDPTTLELTRYAGRAIGEVLATLVNTLNPSVIVLGGSVAHASDVLLAGVREVVYRRSIPLATQQLQIVLSRAGAEAGVLGAAMLVVQEVLSPASVSARIAHARSD